MRLLSLFIIFLGLLLVISCKSGNYTINRTVLSLQTPVSAYFLKSYITKKNDIIYYLSDLRTFKKIYIFNAKGDPLKEISLSEFYKSHSCEISDVEILKDNEILLLSKTNQLYIVDNKLNIIKQFNYYSEYHRGHRMSPHLLISNNRVFTNISNMWPSGKTFNDYYTSGEYLNAQPQFSVINLETGRLKLIGSNLVNRYLKPIDLDSDMIHYFGINNGIVNYHSAFSDTVYGILDNGKIQPLQKIDSKIGNITMRKSTLKEHLNNDSLIYKIAVSSSFIDRVYFSEYNKYYYIIIRKPLLNHKEFPFNILIYDQKWKKLDELEFAGDSYKLNFLVVKAGLLMERANTNSEKRIFDCLVYNN